MSAGNIKQNWCERMVQERGTRATSTVVRNSNEQFVVRLIEESGLTAIVGKCRELMHTEPMNYNLLLGACRRVALDEAGPIIGIIPITTVKDSTEPMEKILRGYIAENSQFKNLSEEEKDHLSSDAALEFVTFCSKETAKPNGIIRELIEQSLGLRSMTEKVAAGRSC